MKSANCCISVLLMLPVFPTSPSKATMNLRKAPFSSNGSPPGSFTAGNAPGGDPFDENGAFLKFIVAFDGLVGKTGSISSTEMQQFADFILQVTYPPNPIRHLDNSLTSDQQAGRNFYFNITSDTVQTCNGCHHLDPSLGFFGTDGFSSFEAETQDFKIPHLRNAYQKVGMFGMPALNSAINAGNNGNQGPQVRGFGFLHDGSVDTLFRFHNATVFNGGFDPNGGDTTRRQVEQFVLAFDSNFAPIVGQQITLTSTNAATVGPRIDLLLARAGQNECDVVVKGTVGGVQRGAVRVAGAATGFKTDRAADPLLTDAQVRNLATTAGQELTYTCVPPGSGIRIGIDRDEDGCLDHDDARRHDDHHDRCSPMRRRERGRGRQHRGRAGRGPVRRGDPPVQPAHPSRGVRRERRRRLQHRRRPQDGAVRCGHDLLRVHLQAVCLPVRIATLGRFATARAARAYSPW